ncbi:MAG: PEP-CTERM sorting domain-containing protein [Phycisphaerae bacterium]|nr:PEP-CTERM sorting domain-containing protein [Phycisphaerae bacterium]
MFVLKIGVGTHALGELFGTGFTKYGGEVKGMITPEPATMSLLVLGGVVVLARRRRRHAA